MVFGVMSGALRLARPWWRQRVPCYSRTSVARVLTFRDHRIEFAIVQQPSIPRGLPSDFDDRFVLSATQHATHVAPGLPAQSAGGAATGPQVPVVQQPSNPRDRPPGFDQHFMMFSTRYASYVPPELSAQSAGRPAFGVLPTADGGNVVWAVR